VGWEIELKLKGRKNVLKWFGESELFWEEFKWLEMSLESDGDCWKMKMLLGKCTNDIQ
jgi:hypothetical protein